MGIIFLLIIGPILYAIRFWYIAVVILIASFMYGILKLANTSKHVFFTNHTFVALITGISIFLVLLLPDLREDIIATQNYRPGNTGIAPDFVIFSPIVDDIIVYGAISLITSLFVYLTISAGIALGVKKR